MVGKLKRQPKNKSPQPPEAASLPDKPKTADAAPLVSAPSTAPDLPILLDEVGSADGVPGSVQPMQEMASVAAEPVSLSAWHLCGETVIGLAHRRKGLPCQDAITFRNLPRPILALSDGAGSAAVSELGAQAMVSGVSRFLMSLEDDLGAWLDVNDITSTDQSARWARRLLLHAQGILDDLARSERRNIRDLRGTLLLAVIGMRQVFWWQVGDGAIVVRRADGMHALGTSTRSKGEFANQTCFVDIADIGMVQYGVFPTAELTGLALMSDGGAEKMVALDGSRVAARLGDWFDAVADDRLSPDKIALAFHESAMWERTNLDDRSVLLASRPSNCSG